MVIGVLAILTIPALIKSYQKIQYVTALKKAYSQMTQVLKIMAVENEEDGIESYFGTNTTTSAGTAIAEHYKVLNICGTASEIEGQEKCFAKFNDYYNGDSSTFLNWGNANSKFKFITADEMSFAVYSYGDNCTYTKTFTDAPKATPLKNVCGWVYIDINGLKKPNYLGRDVFLFYITSNKVPLLYPHGGFYHGATGTISGGGDGWWNYNDYNGCSEKKYSAMVCAARIIEKGWVMDY